MHRSTRRAVALASAALATVGGGWVAVAATHAADRPTAASNAAARTAAQDRFLQLTGDTDQPTSAGGAAPANAAGTINPLAPRPAPAPAELKCSHAVRTRGTLPNGWCIRPAGKNYDVLRFPLGLLPVNGGKKIIVSSDGGGVQGLTVIDAQQKVAVPSSQANLFMGLAKTPDGRILASGGNANRVFRFRLAGDAIASQDATEQATFPLHNGLDGQILSKAGDPPPTLPATDGIRVPGYPGPLAGYGNYVFVAGTLSEPTGTTPQTTCPNNEPACARVSVIDTRTDAVVARIPVGLDAIGLAVDSARNRLYVANWGDEAGRGNGAGGTVSVVDLSGAPSTWHESSYVVVGHHPSAVQLSEDGQRLFVANTNDDSLSILDVTSAQPQVVATQTLSPGPGIPVGAHPDALALSPGGDTLFVALAGMNAVEVLDGHTGQRLAGAPVYIPTGWYPSALTVTGSRNDYNLWIANAKGNTPGPGYNSSVFTNGDGSDGSVTMVHLPVPADRQNDWTKSVRENDNLDAATVDPCNPGQGIRVSEVLCPPHGEQSPIKHVVYIVTENKTFDQYFGDMPTSDGYRADPKFLLYGQPNTPNHHAIADSYSLGDNFFSDAEVSVTGHSWTSGAIATDHNEKTWPADYDQGARGTHGNGDPLRSSIGSGDSGGLIQGAEDELNDPEGGYLFEAFKNAGAVPPDQAENNRLSMAIYGEHTARESGHSLDDYQAPHWKDGDIEYYDTCRAEEFITGKAPSDLVPYDNHFGTSAPTDVATYGCQGRSLPDQFTLKHWEDVYDQTHGGRDVMPSFIYMSLPDNHTMATNVGSPTPQSMVADNDYAIGRIVDALSHSPFWKNTLVVQTEDDTQVAGDHVSALRDYLLVASPWAQPGPDHQWGSMPALLRTIEQIFGVDPISIYDQLAAPMHDAFLPSLSDQPNLKPYDAIRPAVPFALNSADAPGAAASTRMDCWKTYDLCDEQTLNAILYAAIRGTPLHLPSYAEPADDK